MKAIVTGVAGFIGSNLARELLNDGFEVIGIDNINGYYSKDLKSLRLRNLSESSGFQFQNIDLIDRLGVERLIQETEPEHIYHLAAQAGVRLPIDSYERYVESNLTGFSNIAIAAAKFGIPNFLYASSSSVYGNSRNLPYSENESGLTQVSFYGATKYSNEIVANSLSICSKTKFRGMRFFTVYGPMGRPDMAYFRLIHCALNNKKFHLYGDGTLRRDFTFITDVITSIKLLGAELEKEKPSHSDVVNVGGGKPNSMNELIACISATTGKKIEIIRENSAIGDVRETVADHTLQNEITGFIPEVSLEKGIEVTVEWARQPDIQTNLGFWIA